MYFYLLSNVGKLAEGTYIIATKRKTDCAAPDHPC